jgi:hypothetical protein
MQGVRGATRHASHISRLGSAQDLPDSGSGYTRWKVKTKGKTKEKRALQACTYYCTGIVCAAHMHACPRTYNRRRPKPKASCLHDQPRKEKYRRSGRKSFHRECMAHRSFDRLLQVRAWRCSCTYCDCAANGKRLGKWHGFQSTTLTSCLYKNIY